jgi:hypothetical protein
MQDIQEANHERRTITKLRDALRDQASTGSLIIHRQSGDIVFLTGAVDLCQLFRDMMRK